ncbi:MAG: hypothetical protein QE278_11500 [Limnobacter sp.]|nr:hypothetical protein [Limnobacter sp.]
MINNLKHTPRYLLVLALTGLMAACGSDNAPDGTNLGALSQDGIIDRAEATSLVQQRSEQGEPVEVNDLNLSKSETDEPFDI